MLSVNHVTVRPGWMRVASPWLLNREQLTSAGIIVHAEQLLLNADAKRTPEAKLLGYPNGHNKKERLIKQSLHLSADWNRRYLKQ